MLVDFDPIAIQIGPLAVHWYGLMYLLAFMVFFYLGRHRAARGLGPLTPKQVEDLLFYGVLGVIIGGRLGYMLFYGTAQLMDDPLSIVRIWEGGMSFHGGLLGVITVMILYARRIGCSFWALADFVAPLVPQGLMFGRLGNFINGELWGHYSDKPWAMIFPQALPQPNLNRTDLYELYMAGALDNEARHPSPLYQAGLEGLLLFILLYWYSRKPRPRMAVSGWFLIGYGLFRGIAEFFRVPDAHLGHLAFGWLTMGQLLSLPMILFGLALLYFAYTRKQVDALRS
ncbi:MAG: prolipoprotein diacylglyceryl transferase [Wenzhouxiangellaceae bacterium]